LSADDGIVVVGMTGPDKLSVVEYFDLEETLRPTELVYGVVVREPAMLFVFAVAFGLVDFATVPPTTALSTTLFGWRSGGTVIGLVSLSHQIGSAIGSYAGGLIHDFTGSYLFFFLAGALLSAAAAAMSWAISEAPELALTEAPAA